MKLPVLYDGSQAVDFVNKRKPELIILDLMLPEVDGIEICRTLKKRCHYQTYSYRHAYR